MIDTTAEATSQHGAIRGRGVLTTSPYYDALLRLVRRAADNGRGGELPLVIGITSCKRREGVTTVALNLAAAAAAASEQGVLLVDANAEKPALHSLLKFPKGQDGLLNVLAGQEEPFSCTIDSPIEGLSFMPCGKLAPGVTPAYDPRSIEEMFDHLKHVFPLTIIDMPPANELTPCFALAAKLDGLLLVVESGRVDPRTLQRAQQQLQTFNANVLGVVLNKWRRPGPKWLDL
jgi:protein-tyrosine kinase